jgi:hypothetical protein
MSNYIKVLPIQNQPWQRPTDWVTIPQVGVNEEVAYMVNAIWNTTINPCALLCNGTGAGYTVDWGDGTITNHNFNTKAERNYVYANITSPLSIRGYKTVLVKITPQAGATITNFNIQQRHTTYNFDYRNRVLDLLINYNNLTALTMAGATLSNIYLHSIVIKKVPNNNLVDIGSSNLKYYEIKTQISGTVNNPFNSVGHNNLKVKIDMRGVTYFVRLAPYNTASFIDLSEVIFPNSFTQNEMLGSSYAILALPDLKDKIIVGSADYLFWQIGGNPNFHTIPAINMSQVTSVTGLLASSAGWIQKVLWYGLTRSHGFPNQLLDNTSLNEIFTNLGTAVSGASITITGNPGAATCNQSIATAKGWTVIN